MRRRSLASGWRWMCAALALAACGDSVSTAGDFDESRTSTAGPFVDDAPNVLYSGLSGPALAFALDRDFSPAQTVGYGPARDALYVYEQAEVGAVCGVYTAYCAVLGPGDPSQEASARGLNAEHVWPQSMGARAEPLRSDLHHLFPSREPVNSSRGNLPFGEIPDTRADAWYRAAESQSAIPQRDLDMWSERGAGLFEPREDRKGDVARAVFYVVTIYPDQVEAAFFRTMRDDLLDWNRRDPPDARERARSAWVATLQGTENPFVLDPGLAARIWDAAVPLPPPTPSASRTLWISEIHYDNVGADVGEGVEVSGTGTLDGWQLVFVNGKGGATYETVPLAGVLDGAHWVPVEGVQNGSPDGIALVDPSGHVVEALAYEGSFRAVGGAVDGVRFENIGASEAPDTPPAQSLSRLSPEAPWRLGRASPGR